MTSSNSAKNAAQHRRLAAFALGFLACVSPLAGGAQEPKKIPLVGEQGRQIQAAEAEAAGRALGLHVSLIQAREPAALDGLFTAMARDRVHAVLVHPSQMIGTNRERIAELAAKNRLPAIGLVRWFPEAGGLLSYGGRDSDRFRRAAHYAVWSSNSETRGGGT